MATPGSRGIHVPEEALGLVKVAIKALGRPKLHLSLPASRILNKGTSLRRKLLQGELKLSLPFNKSLLTRSR